MLWGTCRVPLSEHYRGLLLCAAWSGPERGEPSTTDYCSLSQHALATSPCGAAETTLLTTIMCHASSASVRTWHTCCIRVFTVWKGSGLVSSHGVCVLLFSARTGKGLCAGVERGGDVLCAAGRVWSVTALSDSNGTPDTPSQARVGEDKLSHNSECRSADAVIRRCNVEDTFASGRDEHG